MRPPIRGPIVFFLRKSGCHDKKRTDWTLMLAWAGIALALWIIIYVLAVR
jgi:hypothetical protein